LWSCETALLKCFFSIFDLGLQHSDLVCHLRGNIGPLDHRTVFGYRVGSAADEVSDIAESQVNFESDG
jgi:hypothetical protein